MTRTFGTGLLARWRTKAWLGAALLLGLASASAAASTFPERALTVVVPFPPGGTTDIVARAVAAGMARELGQSVVVDNRPGAGGNVGAELVARAKPDGHTLLITTAGPLSINPHLYRHLSFDPLTDFAPVSLLATVPIMLVANPGQPFSTVAELIDYARANPGKLTYGSQGNGTTSHLTMELLKRRAGVDILHVPYRGSAPAANDLMAGVVQIAFDNSPSTLPFVRGERMRALGVASAQRVPALTDLPAIAETIEDFSSEAWFAIVAPAGIPEPVQARLHAAVAATLAQPTLRERFTELGVDLTASSSAELAEFIRTESDKWGAVARDAGVQID